MTFDQQLDLDGGAHDVAPAVERLKLFNSATQIRGQAAMATDPPAAGDAVVFRLDLADRERSGSVLAVLETGCVKVDERATGRVHWPPCDLVRHESQDERTARERDGFYVEDLPCSR